MDCGAVAVNYMKAMDPVLSNGVIEGVIARDEINQTEYEIRARAVLDTTGPGSGSLLDRFTDGQFSTPLTFSRDASLVVRGREIVCSAAEAAHGTHHNCTVSCRNAPSLFYRWD